MAEQSILDQFFSIAVDKGGEFSDRWLDKEFGAAQPTKTTAVAIKDPAAPVATPQPNIIYMPLPGTQTQLPIDRRILFITGGVVGLLIIIKFLS